jgi:hypothetical protein
MILINAGIASRYHAHRRAEAQSSDEDLRIPVFPTDRRADPSPHSSRLSPAWGFCFQRPDTRQAAENELTQPLPLNHDRRT